MRPIMGRESVLVWNGKSDAIYREARRQIAAKNGIAPSTVKELDFPKFFAGSVATLAYVPVFQGTTGWWGELLGTNAKIRSKIIISPECQIYEIGTEMPAVSKRLFAAEAMPKSFKRIRETVISVKDMIATDSGTILALLVGNNENKLKNCIKTAGGEYFGCLGGY